MKYEFPEILVETIINSYFDYDVNENDYPNKISVTSLIDAPYIQKMKKYYTKDLKHKLATDKKFALEFAKKNWWIILGKAVHSLLEEMPGVRFTKEKRLNMDFLGTIITGKWDLYDHVEKEIPDYKVTSKYTVTNEERLHDYYWQLNILRYIAKSHNYEVDKLSLIFICRDLMPQDKYTDKFPENALVKLPVPIFPDNKIEEFIKSRIEYHKSYERQNGCDMYERWGKPDTWAVIKEGAKTAYKVLKSEFEATELAKSKKGYNVEFRPAEDTRCKNYCDFNIFCTFYKEKYG